MNCDLYWTTDANGNRAFTCKVCGRPKASTIPALPRRMCRTDGGPKPVTTEPAKHPVMPRITVTRAKRTPEEIAAAKAKDAADSQAGAAAIGEPGLLAKGQHYALALARWFRAGCPRRTPEEAQRCEAICRTNACGLYDVTTNGCKRCGCKLSSQRWAIASKTAMATELCPVRKW
jgi:hypothetical protein